MLYRHPQPNLQRHVFHQKRQFVRKRRPVVAVKLGQKQMVQSTDFHSTEPMLHSCSLFSITSMLNSKSMEDRL